MESGEGEMKREAFRSEELGGASSPISSKEEGKRNKNPGWKIGYFSEKRDAEEGGKEGWKESVQIVF